MAIPKMCRAQGCSTINMDGANYCEVHKRIVKEAALPREKKSYHKIYNTAAWKQLSTNVRTKNPICQCCGLVKADVCDHIIELQDDDSLGLLEENLQTLCHECHNSKTARVNHARKNKYLDKFYIKYLKEINRDDPRNIKSYWG